MSLCKLQNISRKGRGANQSILLAAPIRKSLMHHPTFTCKRKPIAKQLRDHFDVSFIGWGYLSAWSLPCIHNSVLNPQSSFAFFRAGAFKQPRLKPNTISSIFHLHKLELSSYQLSTSKRKFRRTTPFVMCRGCGVVNKENT